MKPRTDKPNVIVFFTDQQRWDTSGLHGNPLGLMPTFDRVAQQGKSLMPILRRETDSVQDDVFIQISESQVGRAVRTKRWKYSVRAEGLPGSEVSNTDTYTEELLYNLEADPCELHNLIHYQFHAKVTASIKVRLLRRMEAAGGIRPRIKDAERYPDPGQIFVPEAEIKE
jgi:arylsulfatase A-like enzyme